jgi:hypothetical protein
MSDLSKISRKIGLPAISQVGVVVADVERAAEQYAASFGLGPFTIYEFVPDKHWFREKPSPLKLKMAKAMWGPVEYELIQPLEGPSLHQEHLDAHGEGVQHLGFTVSNYEEIFDAMLAAGFEPVMRAESYVEQYQGHLKACYFDTRKIGGVIIEIIWRSWQTECNT